MTNAPPISENATSACEVVDPDDGVGVGERAHAAHRILASATYRDRHDAADGARVVDAAHDGSETWSSITIAVKRDKLASER